MRAEHGPILDNIFHHARDFGRVQTYSALILQLHLLDRATFIL